MKRKIFSERNRRIIFIALPLIVVMLVASNENPAPASAKPADTYTMDWHTIDDGGAQNLTGGTYSLGGTIGQADAGRMTNGMYVLTGGFWSHVLPDVGGQFLPMILKNP